MERAYKSVELPSDVPGIGYTLRHRMAVELLIDYHCKKAIGKEWREGRVFTKDMYDAMHNRGVCHDMDKVCCSLCYPQMTADYFHRMFNGHHIEGLITNNFPLDWIEMIFDWESAAYTKPDKKRNAYGVATTLHKDLFKYVQPFLNMFGLTSEDTVLIDEIKEQIPDKVYETDLIDAILRYIHLTHIPMMQYMSRIDDVGYKKTFGQNPPFRHYSTGGENGNYFERPNYYTKHHKYAKSLEMIHGTFEAEIFNMDKLCGLSVQQAKDAEGLLKDQYEQMVKVGNVR